MSQLATMLCQIVTHALTGEERLCYFISIQNDHMLWIYSKLKVTLYKASICILIEFLSHSNIMRFKKIKISI